MSRKIVHLAAEKCIDHQIQRAHKFGLSTPALHSSVSRQFTYLPDIFEFQILRITEPLERLKLHSK